MAANAKTEDRVTTKAALARAIGVDAKQITRWTARDDWPFARNSKEGDWSVADVRRWRSLNVRDNALIEAQRTTLHRDRVEAETKLRQLQAAKLAGEMVPAAKHEADLIYLAELFVQCFEDIEQTFPTLLAGMAPDEIEPLVKKHLDYMRENLLREAGRRAKASSNGKKRRPGRPRNGRVR